VSRTILVSALVLIAAACVGLLGSLVGVATRTGFGLDI